jgi:hypothetical protein
VEKSWTDWKRGLRVERGTAVCGQQLFIARIMKPPSHAFVSKEEVMQGIDKSVLFGLALPGIDENTNLGSRFREPRFDRKQREFRAWTDTL